MRLPVTVPLSTKDGTSNKNARLTNCLKESRERKDAFVWVRGVKQPAPPIDKAVVRPGLVLEAEGTGVGGGLVAFDNDLVSVYGTTLGFSVTEPTAGVWTDYTIGSYTIADEIIEGWSGGDDTSLFLFFNSSTYTTSDGQSLTDQGTRGITFAKLPSGAYFDTAANLWGAVGQDVLEDWYFYTSSDAVTWTQGAAFPVSATCLFSIGTTRYATNAWEVYSSVDDWATSSYVGDRPHTTGSPSLARNFAGTVYVVGSGHVHYSSNGSSWTDITLPLTGNVIGFAYHSGRFYFSMYDFTGPTISVYSCSAVTASAGDYTLETTATPGPLVGSGVLAAFHSCSGGLVLLYTTSDGVLYDNFIKSQVLSGGGGSGTIPALATVPTGLYDFAQSST